MKCKHCGNNLNIEDKFCPYCGSPNPFAKKHQQEMDRFARDYEETKQDVLEETSRFNRRTVRITVIAVMIALIAVMCLLLAMSDDIRYWREERNIAAHVSEYSEAISGLMEERDYISVYSYMSRNHLTYINDLRKYDAVYDTSMHYRFFYDDMMYLRLKKAIPEKYSYYKDEELIESIAKNIHQIYEYMKPQDYNKDAFSDECVKYMEDLRDEMEVMTAGYFGLSMDDARSMRELSESRINVLLEDNYE